MVVIDLKLISGEGHSSASCQKEMADELWSNHVLPIDGLCAYPRFSPMRKTLQRQLQDQELLLLGPVLLDETALAGTRIPDDGEDGGIALFEVLHVLLQLSHLHPASNQLRTKT